MSVNMVLFDLDGTLWNSAKEVADSWNIVLENYKIKWKEYDDVHDRFASQIPHITADMMESVMGRTMDEIARTFMPDADPVLRKEVFHFCETYEVEYIMKSGAVLYSGVKDTLENLQKSGYKLAVVSNCQKDYVKAFLVSMGMEKYFCDYEEWGRTLLTKGENIRLVMERNGCDGFAVYVGDTQKDMDAAVKAGIPFVLADYGFGDADSPDAVMKNIIELPELIRKMSNSF